MRHGVLLDTGPLIAFLNRRDEYHEWAMAHWDLIAPPMLTCEAVLSEACFLLSRMHVGSEPIMDLLQRKIVAPSFRLEDQIRPVQKLLNKYRSVPVSLADACLIRMSELYPENPVLTLDSDFNLYRRNGRQVIPVTMPP